MADRELRNPFRNERDAFRMLVIVVVAGAVVIAGAEIVGSRFGAALALIALTLAAIAVTRWLRAMLAARSEEDQAPVEAPSSPETESGPPGH